MVLLLTQTVRQLASNVRGGFGTAIHGRLFNHSGPLLKSLSVLVRLYLLSQVEVLKKRNTVIVY